MQQLITDPSREQHRILTKKTPDLWSLHTWIIRNLNLKFELEKLKSYYYLLRTMYAQQSGFTESFRLRTNARK